MGEVLCGGVTPFGYADDVSLCYEIIPNASTQHMIQMINDDLAALKLWGDDNHTSEHLRSPKWKW